MGLDIVEFIMEVEDEFELSIPDVEIEQIETGDEKAIDRFAIPPEFSICCDAG